MYKDHSNGEIAVLKVELEANKKGFTVSYPRSQHARYDMLIDDEKKIYRTQIKYLNAFDMKGSKKSKNSMRLNFNPSSLYTTADIDLFLIYLPCKDVVLSIPPNQFHKKLSITVNINNPKAKKYYKNFLW